MDISEMLGLNSAVIVHPDLAAKVETDVNK